MLDLEIGAGNTRLVYEDLAADCKIEVSSALSGSGWVDVRRNAVYMEEALFRDLHRQQKIQEVVYPWLAYPGLREVPQTDVAGLLKDQTAEIRMTDRLTDFMDEMASVLGAISETNLRGVSFAETVGIAIRLEEADQKLVGLAAELDRCRAALALAKESVSEGIYRAAAPEEVDS